MILGKVSPGTASPTTCINDFSGKSFRDFIGDLRGVFGSLRKESTSSRRHSGSFQRLDAIATFFFVVFDRR
jgi:hypothetical protein